MRKTVILLIACVCFAMSANAQRNLSLIHI